MGVPPYLYLYCVVAIVASSSFRDWEILQVGRLLALLGGHQIAFLVHEIGLSSDTHRLGALDAQIFRPLGPRLCGPAIALLHRPGARQGMVGDGDLIVQEILVRLAA